MPLQSTDVRSPQPQNSNLESSGPSSVARSEGNSVANFCLIALYQVVVRIGWIFKTESIIMPAALDVIGGPGWLRGCLPLLNRLGHSIPPLLIWPAVRSAALKKSLLTMCSLIMGASFWLLALVWGWEKPSSSGWMPALFLAIYAVFFASTGVNQLVLSTLIGKLVQPHRRGRLMLVANGLGAVGAVIFALWLLGRWLHTDEVFFFGIFGFAGTCFILAGMLAALFREPKDFVARKPHRARAMLLGSFRAIGQDREFRTLVIVASLFGMSLTLFPHYQALARDRLQVGFDYLLPWLVAQNIGVALFSVPAGTAADRFGNRFVLRVMMLAVCAAPISAMVVPSFPWLGGAYGFSVVFVLLGLTPVTMRLLMNYALEMASPRDQPRYLSALSLCIAGPAVFTSPLLGWTLDVTSFEAVFGFVSCLVFAGWLLTFRLIEPRHRVEQGPGDALQVL